MRALLLPVLVLGLAAGCGGEEDDTPPVAGARDCFAIWNGPGNEENRAQVVEEAEFDVATASRFVQIADFGEGADEDDFANAEKEGCSYLFHTDHRYLTFSGLWENSEFRWGMPPTISGSWSPEQDLNTEDNATVARAGTLEKRAPAGPPAESAPTVEALEPPPPAWIETKRGSFWLGYSTFCWRSGCADYVAPSCSDSRHVPKVIVDRGEIVHAHLGFLPNGVSLASFEQRHSSPEEIERRVAGQEIAWRVERPGAFALMTRAKGGGDASYVACSVLDND